MFMKVMDFSDVTPYSLVESFDISRFLVMFMKVMVVWDVAQCSLL
jgi:hypothetical protein